MTTMVSMINERIAFYSINGRERGLAHFSVWTRGRHAGRALICRYMAFLESVVFR